MRARSVRVVGAALAAALAVGSAVLPGTAAAAPGDLDGGFGTAGRVTGLLGGPEDVLVVGTSVLTLATTTVNSDSTLLLRAHTATGAPDPAWFGDGSLDVAVSDGGIATTGRLAVDGTGRLLVAAGLLADEDGQRIWRFEPDGDLDTTFGGDGTVARPNRGGFPQVTGLGVQPDGDLVVGINDAFIVGGLSQFPQVVRLTSGGEVAQTVDVLADYNERGAPVTVEVDGAGRPHVLVPDDGALAVRRYTAGLALDSTFSGDGQVAVRRPGGGGDNENWGGDLDVAADGSVLVTGTVGTYQQVGANPPVEVQEATLVTRLTAAGVLDTTFSADGIATLARPAASDTRPGTIRALAGGGAVVSGDASFDDQEQDGGLTWQVTAAGTPETGFSGDGRLERDVYPYAARVAPGGARLYTAESDGSLGSWELSATSLVVPAAATAPGAPTAVRSQTASATTVQVAFTAPANTGGSPVTGFAIKVYAGSNPTPVQTVPVAVTGPGTGDFSAPAVGLTPATRYRFTVTATNAVGTGPASAASAWALPPFTTVERFVRQQFADFTSKAPTAAELSSLKGRIEAGTTSPAAAVVEVSSRPEWATLDPLTRIYYAYFGRAPDTSGLKYWLGKRRAGTTVTAVSDQFVKSNEFKTKYGSLTNRAFVQLVYENVLGRSADAAGLASWTSKLDKKTKTRGGVMVQFSESSEHKNRRAGEVGTVSITFGLLTRAPSTAELATWATTTKTSKEPLATSILTGAAYDVRIPAA